MKKIIIGLCVGIIQYAPALSQHAADSPAVPGSFLVRVDTAQLHLATAELEKNGFEVSVVHQCVPKVQHRCQVGRGQAVALVPVRPGYVTKWERILNTLPGISEVRRISTDPFEGQPTSKDLRTKEVAHLSPRDETTARRSRVRHKVRYAATIDVRKTIDIDGMPASARSMVKTYNESSTLPLELVSFLKNHLQSTDRLSIRLAGPNHIKIDFFVTDKLQNMLEEIFAMKHDENISVTISMVLVNSDSRIEIYAFADGTIRTVTRWTISGRPVVFAHRNIGDDPRRTDILKRFVEQLTDDIDSHLRQLSDAIPRPPPQNPPPPRQK